MRGFSSDPHEILGIARDATQRRVKQAYRRLAMKFHPDHNPDRPETAERFKQIQWAYACLSGRKKPGRCWKAAFHRRQYPPALFKNEHPFFSFYWAMKTHGDRIRKNWKES